MPGESTIITLLPPSLARRGVLFVNEGESPECRRCKLRKVCMENAKPGRVYRVSRVRKMSHDCPIYGKVHVVEAEEVEFEVAVEPRLAVVGAIITYRPYRCGSKLCPNRMVCSPDYIRKPIKVKILEDKGWIRCQQNVRLKRVLVKAVD